MIIYGYTRVSSEGGYNGKESETVLFPDNKRERDRIMYEDYSDTFDVMAEELEWEDGTDANGNSKMTEEEFMKELSVSKDESHDVFGLIQASDSHVQYEPFTKVV